MVKLAFTPLKSQIKLIKLIILIWFVIIAHPTSYELISPYAVDFPTFMPVCLPCLDLMFSSCLPVFYDNNICRAVCVRVCVCEISHFTLCYVI